MSLSIIARRIYAFRPISGKWKEPFPLPTGQDQCQSFAKPLCNLHDPSPGAEAPSLNRLLLPRREKNPVFLHDFCVVPILTAQFHKLNETFGLLATLEWPDMLPSTLTQIDHLEASV